jgi:hypothetical protein
MQRAILPGQLARRIGHKFPAPLVSFRKLGFIDYNGELRVHSSLLNISMTEAKKANGSCGALCGNIVSQSEGVLNVGKKAAPSQVHRSEPPPPCKLESPRFPCPAEV